MIDHNLAFDETFDLELFWDTHVFQSQFSNLQLDFVTKHAFEANFEASLDNWTQWWNEVPDDWKQENEEAMLFNLDKALQRLKKDAQGIESAVD